MSKPNKTNKLLVRNVSAPARPCKVPETKKSKPKKVHFQENKPKESEKPKCLCAPEFSSILQLASEVAELRKAQGRSRSAPELPKCRNLDFLPEEKIYHDLVDLDFPDAKSVNKVRSQSTVRSTFKKDPEPEFGKFLKYTLEPEYFFTSFCRPVIKKNKPVFDGKSIYNKIQDWKEKSGVIFD